MEDKEKAINLLKKYNQQKVLKKLQENNNSELIEQILNINFKKVEECIQKIGKKEEFKNDKIESITYTDLNKLNNDEKKKYEQIGRNIISNGKYAVVTMAGGQRNKTRTYWSKRYFFDKCKT